jgi:hypothetical protein
MKQPIFQRALSDDDDMTIDTLTGQIIETISEMSIPAVHEGGPIKYDHHVHTYMLYKEPNLNDFYIPPGSDAPPVVNMGVMVETDIVNVDSNGFLIIPMDKSIVSQKNTKVLLKKNS